jgi:DNA transformation protein
VKDDSFRQFVLDQLHALGGVRCRAMFGGYGLYQGERFFGIIHGGRVFLKTHEQTRPEYVARGMQPFRPNDRQVLKSYYEVPVDVVEDPDRLAEWAGRAASSLGGA